jgi:hypothetical protein
MVIFIQDIWNIGIAPSQWNHAMKGVYIIPVRYSAAAGIIIHMRSNRYFICILYIRNIKQHKICNMEDALQLR